MRRGKTQRLTSLTLPRQKLAAALLGLAIAIFALAGPDFAGVNAQSNRIETSGISIVPSITEVPGVPGSSRLIEINATNTSSAPQAIKVFPQALVPLDPLVDDSLRARFDASRWLEPETSDLLLDANQSKTVKIKLNVPQDAGPGGHYAMVTFRILSPQGASTGAQAKVSPEVSALIFINTPGEVNEFAQLETQPVGFWHRGGQHAFVFTVKNTGNIHILPSANLTIKDFRGHIVEVLPLSPRMILPNTAAKFTLEWQNRKAGRYSANLELSYGTPIKVISADMGDFIVLPPWWQLALFAALVYWVARSLYEFGRRRYQRWRSARRQPDEDEVKRISIPVTKLDDISDDPEIRDSSRR